MKPAAFAVAFTFSATLSLVIGIRDGDILRLCAAVGYIGLAILCVLESGKTKGE